MKTLRKSVDEKIYIEFQHDDEVSSSAWVTTGGTLSGANYSDDVAYVFFSAGTLNTTYTLTNDATLDDGQIVERSINVQVVDK
jgi:hypothetical protein